MKKYCKICLKEVDQRGDYVVVRDFKEGNLKLEGFYHNPCFTKVLHSATSGMLQRVNELLNKAENIISEHE